MGTEVRGEPELLLAGMVDRAVMGTGTETGGMVGLGQLEGQEASQEGMGEKVAMQGWAKVGKVGMVETPQATVMEAMGVTVGNHC